MAGHISRQNGRKGGRPKGSYGPHRLDKIAMREQVMAEVAPKIQALVQAQIQNALGIKYLVTRDKKTRKFVRIGPAVAGNLREETIEVWEKDPSVHAFTDLMNRTIDKRAQQPVTSEQAGKEGGPLEIIVRTPWDKKGDEK